VAVDGAVADFNVRSTIDCGASKNCRPRAELGLYLWCLLVPHIPLLARRHLTAPATQQPSEPKQWLFAFPHPSSPVRTPSRPRHTQWAFWSRRLRASAAVAETALTACSVIADLRATAGVRSGDNCHFPPRGGGVPGRQRQPLPCRQKQWHLCPTAHGRHVAPPPPPRPPTPALPAARWQPIFCRQQHQRLSRAADPPPPSAKAGAAGSSRRASD